MLNLLDVKWERWLNPKMNHQMPPFYELRPHWEDIVQSITVDYKSETIDHLDVYRGTIGDNYLDGFTIIKKQDGLKTDFLANNYGWMIISNRIAELILALLQSKDVQFLAFPRQNCADNAGDIASEYKLLAIRGVVDCLDTDHSDITWSPRNSKYVEKCGSLAFHVDKIPLGTTLLAIPELPVQVFISDNLFKALNAVGASGCAFKPVAWG